MSELGIEGWMVAEADLEHGYHPYTRTVRVFVFRNTRGWGTLTVAGEERHDVSGTLQSGRASVSSHQYGTLDELAAAIDGDYRAGAWGSLLDAGHENDPDLYAAWVPGQMARDLDGASIFNRDLAHAAGYLDPTQLAAPGRVLDDWQTHAVGAMAATLTDEGWDVFHDQVKVTGAAPAGGLLSEGTEIAGALLARRYGYEAAILVRVDDCGEIYALLAEEGDTIGPSLRPLTDEDGE